MDEIGEALIFICLYVHDINLANFKHWIIIF